MSIRFDAINNLKNSVQAKTQTTSKITAIFGENVFILKLRVSILVMKLLKVYKLQ